VGKNNYQNDKLTFKIAGNKDLWFHAKNMPGSHVIVMTGGADNIPDRVYEEAAALAARYSQAGAAGENPKVEIDYTERKNIKKPVGAAPGYVIYHTNYSMIGDGDISKLKLVSD
jgi:predicted ribosome quality control (RQC) complex YloA/Tae2 family protein